MDVHKLLEGIYKELKKIFTVEDNSTNNNKKSKYPNFLIACLSLVLVGILVVIGTDYFKSTSTVKINSQQGEVLQDSSNISTQGYEETYEKKLQSALETMKGVGRAKVMITLEGSEEQVPAVNINDSTSTTKEKDEAGGTREIQQKNNGSTIVIANDGSKNEPLILQTKKPKIVGVCVIADGANDKNIQLQIITAVTRLYGLTPDKVSVYPMEKK